MLPLRLMIYPLFPHPDLLLRWPTSCQPCPAVLLLLGTRNRQRSLLQIAPHLWPVSHQWLPHTIPPPLWPVSHQWLPRPIPPPLWPMRHRPSRLSNFPYLGNPLCPRPVFHHRWAWTSAFKYCSTVLLPSKGAPQDLHHHSPLCCTCLRGQGSPSLSPVSADVIMSWAVVVPVVAHAAIVTKARRLIKQDINVELEQDHIYHRKRVIINLDLILIFLYVVFCHYGPWIVPRLHIVINYVYGLFKQVLNNTFLELFKIFPYIRNYRCRITPVWDCFGVE